jgi:adenylate cyclase
VSGNVRENIGNKLDLMFEDVGDQDLKNIALPVRVYHVVFGSAAAKPSSGADPEVADADKPSIAVLPFDNMSGDPEQEYFSDGITEDIITDLSKASGLFVISRNTSFTYKGKALQMTHVAAELGVKHLLEGSVRKAGTRVRVNAQLIDGVSGGHLWADRYDRDLTDIFAIQDEITQAIVEQLKVRLLPKEKKAIRQAPTVNVDAYSFFLKGRQYFHHSTKSFLILARQMFAKAVEIDPKYARAYAGIANSDSRLTGWYAVSTPIDEILATADKALELDPQLADAHAARGYVFDISRRAAEAEAAFERALELDPNNFEAYYFYARHCMKLGKREKAAELLIRALEVNPEDSQAPLQLCRVLFGLGRHGESEKYARLGLQRAESALRLHPESSRPAQLGAAALARLGEAAEAQRWLERALAIDPDDNNAIYNAACVWAQIGQPDKAFELLERWAQNLGAEQKNWFLHDSDLDPIRDHPGYAGLLKMIDATLAEKVTT